MAFKRILEAAASVNERGDLDDHTAASIFLVNGCSTMLLFISYAYITLDIFPYKNTVKCILVIIGRTDREFLCPLKIVGSSVSCSSSPCCDRRRTCFFLPW